MHGPDHQHDSEHPRHPVPVEMPLALKVQQTDVPETCDHHSPQRHADEIQQVEHQQREPVAPPSLALFHDARGAFYLFNLRLEGVSALRQSPVRLSWPVARGKTRGA